MTDRPTGRRMPARLGLVFCMIAAQVVALSAPQASAGSPIAGGTFVPVAASRLLDTRSGIGATVGAVAPGATVTVQVTGRGGVPAPGVEAVALTVTVVAPTAGGYLTVYPAGMTQPMVSNLNFAAGQTIANAAVVGTGTTGQVSFTNGSAGKVQLVADVSGYYEAGDVAAGGHFAPLASPVRLLDTRTGNGAAAAAVGPGASVLLAVTGRGGIPATGVGAVVVNVTVTQPTAGGYLTVYPYGASKPATSNLDFAAGQTISNLVTVPVSTGGRVVPVGTGGRVMLYNGSPGSVELIADVAGYITSGSPVAVGGFGSLTPARVLDTRHGVGAATAAVTGDGSVTVQIRAIGGVPRTGVGAVLLNVTVTDPTSPGYITAYPNDQTRPGSSIINFATGQTIPDLVVVPLSADGSVTLFNGSPGTVELIADVEGYITGATAISSGGDHSCAVLGTGQVDCWGADAHGELGDGAVTPAGSPTPVAVTDLAGQVVQLAAGYQSTCALIQELNTLHGGTVECWGANDAGQLGDGSTTSSDTPVAVQGLTGVVAIAGGDYFACALLYTATVSCWGDNFYGQLGNGTVANESLVPTTVSGLHKVTAISAGSNFACAIVQAVPSQDCWGANFQGQLGNGSIALADLPAPVALDAPLSAVAAGGQTACGLMAAAPVTLCWGENAFGQIGNGLRKFATTPTVSKTVGATAIAVGQTHACAIATASMPYCWGNNQSGQTGDGSNTGPVDIPRPVTTSTGVLAVSAGANGTCAIRSGGAIECWGANTIGQLGQALDNSYLAFPSIVVGWPDPAPTVITF